MVRDHFSKYENLFREIFQETLSGEGDSDFHLLTIFSIALASKSKTYIELGVRNGSTSLPISLAAKINGGKHYAVDIEDSDYKCPKELENVWNFQKMDAVHFLRNWDKSNKVGFIYLDDWHAYNHVKEEFISIDQMVGPSSIILVHDLMYGTAPFYHTDLSLEEGQWAEGGPYRAVSELSSNFWEWSTLPWCNGLTILRKKYSTKFHTI
jgi:hypothetical protein